jgi:hypothetical protein
MIDPEPPPHWPLKTTSSDEDGERLDRALSDLMNEDQWIKDFIKRLNYTIEDSALKR